MKQIKFIIGFLLLISIISIYLITKPNENLFIEDYKKYIKVEMGNYKIIAKEFGIVNISGDSTLISVLSFKANEYKIFKKCILSDTTYVHKQEWNSGEILNKIMKKSNLTNNDILEYAVISNLFGTCQISFIDNNSKIIIQTLSN